MLKLAWRNLWRSRTRTLITATAIALAYAVYLIANGVQDYTFSEMREAAAKAAGGAVLVQTDNYLDRRTNDAVMSDGNVLLERVASVDSVTTAAPRLIVSGLLSTSASSTPVNLNGIVPVAEREIHDVTRYLVEGTWFESEREDPIILGSKLVEELDLEVGDRVILTATDGDGEMRRSLFHLEGVLHTGSPLSDRGFAYTTLPAARRSIRMETELTQIGVNGEVPRKQLAEAIDAAIADDTVEVLPWDVAMPDLVGFIEMKKGGGAFFGFLLFIVVLFAITNTFMMIVMERVREFGLVGALGLSPGRTAALLLTETALLALVAMAIGLSFALVGHVVIDTHGIDFSAIYGDNLDVAGVSLTDAVIYSEINPVRWAKTSASVFAMVILAAVYPAYKAMRLGPAEAMRFYE
jgi:ABC-type lipoprotein release transport system permease subunit